ncbi:4-(cytidine 5'-diphospho)-2-C-methyl-D-erythritol kinase [Rhodobacteraceae bacterium CCMM004]|nr:4-(cytidine 5'-diphospho)-2-C-methyl-D-erythritol kinase [Rhodobacteraceae bacterium CCMM004]
MTAAEAFAPAKVNLTLHVTGRRTDGYHLLDSLVAFAGVGDVVGAAPAADWSLTITGPAANGVPKGPDNLVLRAARAMGGAPAALTLTKRLPTAGGIGGGSADAAAALRALHRLDGRALPDAAAVVALGADVPVCLAARPARMTGVGETLAPVPPLAPAHLVLANPGVAVPTPAVFAALDRHTNPAMPADLPQWRDAADLVAWLAQQRNDLEPPARAVCPPITDVVATLAATRGCLLARMSGSGATCFGVYAAADEARAAAAALSAARPGWWVAAAPLLTSAPD